MWSFSIHPNYYKKKFTFFSPDIKKISNLSAKERKVKSAKFRHMTAKEFNDELLNFKSVIDEMAKLDTIR